MSQGTRFQSIPLPSQLEDKKTETEVRKMGLELLKQINTIFFELTPVSGSTASGSYTKYPDGTMIQFGVTTSIATGGNSAVTLPEPFIDTNYCIVNSLILASGSASFGVSNSGPTSASGFTLYSNTAVAGPQSWSAFGRWK